MIDLEMPRDKEQSTKAWEQSTLGFPTPRSSFKSSVRRSWVYETFGSSSGIDLGTSQSKVKFSNDFSLDRIMLKFIFYFRYIRSRSRGVKKFTCTYTI